MEAILFIVGFSLGVLFSLFLCDHLATKVGTAVFEALKKAKKTAEEEDDWWRRGPLEEEE